MIQKQASAGQWKVSWPAVVMAVLAFMVNVGTVIWGAAEVKTTQAVIVARIEEMRADASRVSGGLNVLGERVTRLEARQDEDCRRLDKLEGR